MNKKIIIISAALVVMLLLAVFATYFYFKNKNFIAENFDDNVSIEKNEDNKENGNEVQNPKAENNLKNQIDVKIEGNELEQKIDAQSNFYVCQDLCGDKICQTDGTACKDQLNCPCAETLNDCPEDCK